MSTISLLACLGCKYRYGPWSKPAYPNISIFQHMIHARILNSNMLPWITHSNILPWITSLGKMNHFSPLTHMKLKTNLGSTVLHPLKWYSHGNYCNFCWNVHSNMPYNLWDFLVYVFLWGLTEQEKSIVNILNVTEHPRSCQLIVNVYGGNVKNIRLWRKNLVPNV